MTKRNQSVLVNGAGYPYPHPRDYILLTEYQAAKENWWANQPPDLDNALLPWQRKCPLCGVLMVGPDDSAYVDNGVAWHYRSWSCRRCGLLAHKLMYTYPSQPDIETPQEAFLPGL